MSGVYNYLSKNVKVYLSWIAMGLSVMLWNLSCSKGILIPSVDGNQKVTEIILEWNNLFLELDRYTDSYRPPISSRSSAYIALTAYETAVPILDNYISLSNKFPELKLPKYPKPEEFDVAIALNSAYAYIFKYFFPTTSIEHYRKIEKLERSLEITLFQETNPLVVEKSIRFGQAVASAIADWSATDNTGHQAYYRLTDPDYNIEPGNGNWVTSPDHPNLPLLPHWGKVRSFIVDINNFKVNPPIEFSEDPSSKMYREALELYSLSSPLSEENKWISEFWSDDHHSLTYSPSARWISITNQVIKLEHPPFEKVLETYLRISLALNDASIITWKAKYDFKRERPEQYIRRVINKSWSPYHASPPFPTYPSGHATFGAAASAILSQMYGDNYEFTDNSHLNRTEFNGKPRSFHSFKEMAYENAFSRIAIGVHYRNDCEEGLHIGFIVGNEILKLQLQKAEEKILSSK